jgi:hypothetical protein
MPWKRLLNFNRFHGVISQKIGLIAELFLLNMLKIKGGIYEQSSLRYVS